MNARLTALICGALVLLAAALSLAAPRPLTSEQVIAGVQERYAKIGDLRADFEQVTTLPGGRKLAAAGSAYFKKPNMIRWDFSRPEAQSIITDGRTMWIYEPQLKQVQVYDAALLDARLRMGFFSDLRRLTEDFNVRAGEPTECCHVLELEPKQGRAIDLRHLTLYISRDPMRVVEAKTVDLAGNETNIKFSSIKENTGLKEGLFKFSPPPGTKVIKPQGL